MRKISVVLTFLCIFNAVLLYSVIPVFADGRESQATITIQEGQTTNSTDSTVDSSAKPTTERTESNNKSKTGKEKNLPKMNEQKTIFFSISGSFLLCMTISGYLYKITKAREGNEES